MPESGRGNVAAADGRVDEVRILSFNIAKAFAFTGHGEFAARGSVEARLDGIAALMKRHRIDLAFVSEIVLECGPRPVDQVRGLAERGGFHAWAYCDNYRFGVPGFRIRTGNALLSRFELRPIEVIQLAGRRPFFEPTNNRRILWCEVKLGDGWLLAASLRNDSFDLENNFVQAREILAYVGERSSLLAGDFNADPDDPSMALFRRAGFSGEFDGPDTFPTHDPSKCIDFILAPADRVLVEHRVIESELSDHLPVLSVFRLPN